MATPRSSASRTSFPPGGPISSIPNTCWIYTRKPARSTSAVWRRITTGSICGSPRISIEFGHECCKKIAAAIRQLVALTGKPKRVFVTPALDPEIYEQVSKVRGELADALNTEIGRAHV